VKLAYFKCSRCALVVRSSGKSLAGEWHFQFTPVSPGELGLSADLKGAADAGRLAHASPCGIFLQADSYADGVGQSPRARV